MEKKRENWECNRRRLGIGEGMVATGSPRVETRCLQKGLAHFFHERCSSNSVKKVISIVVNMITTNSSPVQHFQGYKPVSNAEQNSLESLGKPLTLPRVPAKQPRGFDNTFVLEDWHWLLLFGNLLVSCIHSLWRHLYLWWRNNIYYQNYWVYQCYQKGQRIFKESRAFLPQILLDYKLW